MAKTLSNPRLFAAACLLFAGATFFNATASASSTTKTHGTTLSVSPAKAPAPVGKIGPTIPPSPWDDSPSVSVSSRL